MSLYHIDGNSKNSRLSNLFGNRDAILGIIAEIIKTYRKKIGLTVADLAKTSGVSVGVISDLENNRGRVPSLVNFIKLAQVLQIPESLFSELLQGEIPTTNISVNYKKNLRDALLAYGLDKKYLNLIIAQIDAVISIQNSTPNSRNNFVSEKE